MDCKNCEIHAKLICCCGQHPETKETKDFEVDGEILKACPNLTKEGLCAIHDSRPEICRDFEMCSI